MLIIWLQGIWLPLHGFSFESTPLWAGIFMIPLTVGLLVSAPLAGQLSDRYGARWLRDRRACCSPPLTLPAADDPARELQLLGLRALFSEGKRNRRHRPTIRRCVDRRAERRRGHAPAYDLLQTSLNGCLWRRQCREPDSEYRRPCPGPDFDARGGFLRMRIAALERFSNELEGKAKQYRKVAKDLRDQANDST